MHSLQPAAVSSFSSVAPIVTLDSAEWRLADSAARALRGLTHHAGSIGYDTPLEEVHRAFSERQVDFLALVRDGIVTGLCSRLRLGDLLGARFGFALYSRSAAHLAQVAHPLVFTSSTPLRDVLDLALARPGDEFHEDVVLVDEQHALIGLIPVDALARLQTQIVTHQLAQLQRQHEELLAAQRDRRQSQGRYAGLFESHTLGVALVDGTGTVHTHNRRLAELLGVDAAGAALAALPAWIAEGDRPAFLEALAACAQGAKPAAREFALTIPGRGERVFRCTMGWIEETGQACVCLDDVTEQRMMERQLARQEKQSLLDTLVGGIAHELNNKLTPVQGFAELIALAGNAQDRQYADLITKSVAEAAAIIRQLLQLSKPAGMATQRVDLSWIVEEALSMLRFQIRETQCALALAKPEAEVWVQADPAEIKQVVINLVLNALQAMAGFVHSQLRIEVSVARGMAQVEVGDNGVGIPPENLARIFDPFFTTKGPERGTGLGLSVCFSIVRRHHGEIAVDSVPGAGATFTVRLPLAPDGGDRGAPPKERSERRPLETGGLRLDARVLVIEDEPPVQMLIHDSLTGRFGCQVDVAANGVEALERLATARYALVLSDVRMPQMKGTELYLWLREAQPDMAGRFIFITGYPSEEPLQAEAGAWGIPVLTKPFSTQRLFELCAPFLTGPATSPAPSSR